ncbi:hypothetical protein SPJ1_1965 [Streptococcus parauberis KRS-02083]|uniref:Uncharacterized protein n=1 Tax=Streptococcus parauberis KRS-02083 TaxID=1207545 RepID=A0ABN0IPG5_9STRE|nr:hypothetical protein SPJ1_1965 [Streptococcus parauberis KRS-02083]
MLGSDADLLMRKPELNMSELAAMKVKNPKNKANINDFL